MNINVLYKHLIINTSWCTRVDVRNVSQKFSEIPDASPELICDVIVQKHV